MVTPRRTVVAKQASAQDRVGDRDHTGLLRFACTSHAFETRVTESTKSFCTRSMRGATDLQLDYIGAGRSSLDTDPDNWTPQISNPTSVSKWLKDGNI
jgi:hypothetical protein